MPCEAVEDTKGQSLDCERRWKLRGGADKEVYHAVSSIHRVYPAELPHLTTNDKERPMIADTSFRNDRAIIKRSNIRELTSLALHE